MQTALSADALPRDTVKLSRPHFVSASLSTSVRRKAPPRPPTRDDAVSPNHDRPEIVQAIPGNHLAIQEFLQRLLHRPSKAEFASATLRPGYEAHERLLIKNPVDRTLVAHAQLLSQTMCFGHVEIPICRFRDLAVLPELRRRNVDGAMLIEAEQHAKRSNAMLMIAQGEDYRLLQQHGWATLGCDPVSIVSPQRLLGQLPPPEEPESPYYAARMPTTEVRIGRLTDLDDLVALHQRDHEGSFGAVARSPEVWSWLLTKQAHDRIFVYSENDRALAYVVVAGSSVIELVDVTDNRRGSARVLEAVGAEAIEQGRHTLRIHAPISHLVHEWADAAGGQVFASATEDAWMVKVLSYRALLRRLAPELHKRKPGVRSEVSIRIGTEEFLIKPGVRSMKVTRATSKKNRIGISERAAAQLLLGYRTVDELVERKHLVASSKQALEITRRLFPPQSLWRTRWDDMPVRNS